MIIMMKKSRTAECSTTQPSRSIRTDHVVPAALGEQYRNNGFRTQLPAGLRRRLRHRDRWRARDMLAEREQHSEISDIEVWRRLYLPGDLVRVGDVLSPAHVAPPAEYCWGWTWRWDGTAVEAVAHCLCSTDLLAGASWAETMSRHESCEAVLGRMRAANLPILLIVEDGEDGLQVWLDVCLLSEWAVPASSGRCPGGRNARTGRQHQVIWAYEGLWGPWSDEELAVTTAAAIAGHNSMTGWLAEHVDRLMAQASEPERSEP